MLEVCKGWQEYLQHAGTGLNTQGGVDDIDQATCRGAIRLRLLLIDLRMRRLCSLDMTETARHLAVVISQFRSRFKQVAIGFHVACFLGNPGQGIQRQT